MANVHMAVDQTVTEDRGDDIVSAHPRAEIGHLMRIAEALLFAASEPLSDVELKGCLPEGSDIDKVLAALKAEYAERGVNLVRVAGKWAFRTAEDLSFLLRREAVEQKKLSRAALEHLAIIAYHQPVTRAEIEEIRGVASYRGTLDILLEIGWIKMRGRRRTPGRPVTYGTTQSFLEQFGLNALGDLPGMHELKGAGLLDSNLPPDFDVPTPRDGDELADDEDPLEDAQEPELEMHLSEGDDQDIRVVEDDPEPALEMDMTDFGDGGSR